MRRMEEKEAHPGPAPLGDNETSPLRTLDVNTVRELWSKNL